MTAQAPYESLTPDEAAQRLRLIGNECRARCKFKGVDCGTCARSDAAIEMAIAALPERAPVSAGGDAELVARLKVAGRALFRERKVYFEDLETVLDVIEYLERLAATPAPPVGADWVMVPREVVRFLNGESQLDGRWFGDEGPIVHGKYRANYWWRKHLSDAAAPTPAEARGVGDGVRATTPEEAVIADAALRLGVIARDLVARFERQHPRAVKLLRKGEPFFVVKASEPYAWELVRLIRAHEGDGWTAECQEWAEEAIGSPEPRQAQAQGSEEPTP